MSEPTYLSLSQARATLAEMGIQLTDRQIKRAAETDFEGRRKLPFFVDPIEKRLKIEKSTLINIYRNLQKETEISAVFNTESCVEE